MNGNYYYLEESGIHIYDVKIVEHVKKTAETTDPFAASVGVSSSTSPDVKTLIDDMLYTLLADNQVREDQIMVRINVIAHASEESKLRMKNGVKEEIQALERHLVTRIEALKISVDYLYSNNFIFHHDTIVTSIPVSEDTVVVHPSPSTDFFPMLFHDIIFQAYYLSFLVFNYVILYGLDNYVVTCSSYFVC